MSSRALYLEAVHIRDVLGPDSPFREALSTYEDRPGQIAMAEAVFEAIEGEHPLFVEAGTGTGKTLAYLIPAILSGKKVIISTATQALQEQIFTKDIPLAARIFAAHGLSFRSALMKGLNNYLCKRRFEEFRGSITEETTQARRHLPMLEAWAKATRTGERSELEALPENNDVWTEVRSSTDTRIGPECEHFDSCFVTRMRRDAEGAHIVVVNHHLFLADLALRSGPGGDHASAIPNYDAVIFDEAHQIEDIATDFFGVRVSTSRIEALLRDAKRSLAGLKGTSTDAHLSDAVDRSAKMFFSNLSVQQLPSFRASSSSSAGGQSPFSPDSRRRLTALDWNDNARAAATALDRALGDFLAAVELHTERESSLLVARRLRDLRRDFETIRLGSLSEAIALDDDIAQVDDADRVASDDVLWIEVRDRSVVIGASPVNLGPTLRARLFDRVPCVVLTSATLTTPTAGSVPSFHFVRSRLGAPPWAHEWVSESPFKFASRSVLYLPRDIPEPGQSGFEDAAIARIAELIAITEGGGFVLCTSTRSMKRLHAGLTARLATPPLVQGQAPKHRLLSQFRASGHAVLVATMSFWEGVDVPGRALRLVVIDKIPFAVPTDPVVAARCAAITRGGGNAFSQYSVPAAAIALKQGFGRLLRTERDAGVVAILDCRMVTKGYGRTLQGALPPAPRVHQLEDVRRFWSTVQPDD